MQYTGDNLRDVIDFAQAREVWEKWFRSFDEYAARITREGGTFYLGDTNSGSHVSVGHWVIKDALGQIKTCKPGTFDILYAPDESPSEHPQNAPVQSRSDDSGENPASD
jgi:hypothetical protein